MSSRLIIMLLTLSCLLIQVKASVGFGFVVILFVCLLAYFLTFKHFT